jgi:hypothetical protein
MTISKARARELTTRDEQALVDESFHPAIRAFSEADLRDRIARARRLRQKYRDLGQRQGVASKQRGRGGSSDNERTGEKARLFAETIVRFEKRLAASGAAPPE